MSRRNNRLPATPLRRSRLHEPATAHNPNKQREHNSNEDSVKAHNKRRHKAVHRLQRPRDSNSHRLRREMSRHPEAAAIRKVR